MTEPKPWTDDYIGHRGPQLWLDTGFFHYEPRRGGREVDGKYDAWNVLVRGLSDIEREDTQHNTARLLVGLRRVKWKYDKDPETGLCEFTVGMCLLAMHLCNRDIPTRLKAGMMNHLMFDEEICTGPDRHEYCQRILKVVRDLHKKLLVDPEAIAKSDHVSMSEYR